MSLLLLEDVSLSYSNGQLFKNLSLDVDMNERVCIHTGVLDGGTSLLKLCAGLTMPDHGKVLINHKLVTEMTDLEKFHHLSLSFEAGGLLGVFTNYNNIAFPLLYHNSWSSNKIKERIIPLSQQLGLEHLLNAEPHQLNDVQTRLMNLLRSLTFRPSIMLIDELQGGMDDKTRNNALDVLLTHQKEHPCAIVMTVTAGDETSFADRVFAINNLKLEQRKS